MPLNPALWTSANIFGPVLQWSFNYTGAAVNSASVVATLTIDNNPLNTVQFNHNSYDWFGFAFFTS